MLRNIRVRATCAKTILSMLMMTLLVAGCGYRSQLAGGKFGDALSAGARGFAAIPVAVLALRNDSPEPWLDRVLTDSMRREIGARGAFALENDPGRAEWVLRGRIRPLGIHSQSFSRFVAAIEYGLTLQLDLEVVMSNGNVIRLDPSMLSESDVFLASPDIEVTRSNRLEVLRRLSDVLASRVADTIELLERPIPESAEEGG